MNIETAKHLNSLQVLATPFKIEDSSRYELFVVGVNVYQLVDPINGMIQSLYPSIIEARIIKAATEKAGVATATGNCYYDGKRVVISANEDMINALRPELQLLLDKKNAESSNRYEAYRLACAQGTATPPASQ